MMVYSHASRKNNQILKTRGPSLLLLLPARSNKDLPAFLIHHHPYSPYGFALYYTIHSISHWDDLKDINIYKHRWYGIHKCFFVYQSQFLLNDQRRDDTYIE